MLMMVGSSFEGIFQLLVTFIIFIFVLALTFFTTRWIARYQKGRALGRNIHIIESIGVGSNKALAIIEAGGEYFLVGLGKDEVSFISKLDRDKIVISDEADSPGSARSFSEILSDFKSRIGK